MFPAPDYSIYLVTDSEMVPRNSEFLTQVRKSVENGATIVQLREKNITTKEFVELARNVLQITRPKKIPLIINDRIDVALAVDADGVHVGQDDMPGMLARKLLGPNKILGISCSNESQTAKVCEEAVADYVGLGAVYPTQTKDVKTISGPIGIRKSLQILKKHNQKGRKIFAVAIGGINHSNVGKVMFQCLIPGQKLDGVAVVSCIMGSSDSGASTRELVESFRGGFLFGSSGSEFFKSGSSNPVSSNSGSSNSGSSNPVLSKPLVHHITNNVVKNFSANVTLAMGGSPIMSELPEEFEQLAKAPLASLVLNLGTPNESLMKVFISGLQTYNRQGKAVIFDPVGAGASMARLNACRTLLNSGQFSVIKGISAKSWHFRS